MIAEILSTGEELRLGSIIDTNSAYIAQRLEETGADVAVEKQVTIEGTIIGAGISAGLTANLVALDDWEAKDEIIIVLHNTAAGVVYVYPRVKLSVGSAVADNLETFPISAVKRANRYTFIFHNGSPLIASGTACSHS